MIKVQKFKDLGKIKISWLNSRYHFSFSNYYNPERMGFGKLKVVNDDIVKPKAGFNTHPHQDMEIITYVRKGGITHKDSEGNEGCTKAGSVQVMSAGTGIRHSEYNLENEDSKIYQIWIEPHTKGVDPKWKTTTFPKDLNKNNLPLLVSGRKEDKEKGALFINQYASIYGGRIKNGSTIKQKIKDQLYLLVSEGEIEIDGHILEQGDGCEITDEKLVNITAKKESEVVLIDVPK